MQKKDKKMSIVLTGGGTAGHVWPHFALFEDPKSLLNQAEQNQKIDVHYIGSSKGMEKDLVLKNKPQWHYHSISTGKLRRYFSFQNMLDPFKVLFGILQSFFLILIIRPSVVFSKGGFVSAPVVWAAWLCRIPIVIHESDATLALTTKLTLFCATKILLTFPETSKNIPTCYQYKTQEIGLPVRYSLLNASKEESLQYFGFSKEKKTILIFGGSLGAQSLNQKMFAILPELCEHYQVLHIVGKGNGKKIPLESSNYKQFEFLTSEMKYAYAAADLAICRAGASSIFELLAKQVPMILIPLGLEASRGDQVVNAQIFAHKKWAQWYKESIFQGEFAIEKINQILQQNTEQESHSIPCPKVQSAVQIAQILMDTMG